MAHSAICKQVDAEALSHEEFLAPAEPASEGNEEEVCVSSMTRKVTANDKWEKISKSDLPENNNTGRVIGPVPWTGSSKAFTVKTTPGEIETFKDKRGETFCEEMMTWSL